MKYDVQIKCDSENRLITTWEPEGPLTEEEEWALEKAVTVVRSHRDTLLYGFNTAQFVLNVPDQDEGALQLLADGYRQLSRKYRHVARLPSGKTGLEALAAVSPRSVADIMRRAEEQAIDEYLRSGYVPEGDQKTLSIPEFDAFLRATGRKGEKSAKPTQCPDCGLTTWTGTCNHELKSDQ